MRRLARTGQRRPPPPSRGFHLAVIRGASPAYRVLTPADAESLVARAGDADGTPPQA